MALSYYRLQVTNELANRNHPKINYTLIVATRSGFYLDKYQAGMRKHVYMQKQLHIIGLTGGIATGKSTCVQMLHHLVPQMVIFDADVCVRNLYQKKEVLSGLKEYFGEAAILENGMADKAYLRERAFSAIDDRRFLEELFHPRVRQECLALLKQTANKSVSPLFVADVPLLFEGGFDFGQSLNVLVATSRKTQVERLVWRNKWDKDTVHSALSSQIPIQAKHAMADVVFWNEGPQRLLHSQCRRFLQSLSIHF